MLLGRKTHTAGNKIRYSVDYSMWLLEGEHLASGTVTLTDTDITDIVISEVAVTASNDIVFFMDGGTEGDSFVLEVQAISSRGEEKNDTVGFDITEP